VPFRLTTSKGGPACRHRVTPSHVSVSPRSQRRPQSVRFRVRASQHSAYQLFRPFSSDRPVHSSSAAAAGHVISKTSVAWHLPGASSTFSSSFVLISPCPRALPDLLVVVPFPFSKAPTQQSDHNQLVRFFPVPCLAVVVLSLSLSLPLFSVLVYRSVVPVHPMMSVTIAVPPLEIQSGAAPKFGCWTRLPLLLPFLFLEACREYSNSFSHTPSNILCHVGQAP
jgi:hypothetical protein